MAAQYTQVVETARKSSRGSPESRSQLLIICAVTDGLGDVSAAAIVLEAGKILPS